MTLQDFLNTMKISCSFLEREGYKLREVNTSVNRNFWYEKHTEIEGFRISFGWTQYGDEFHVKGLMALKRFNIIEKHLQKVLGGDLIDYYTIYKSPSIEYIPKELTYEATENNIHFVLKNTVEVNLFGFFVKEFYKNAVLIFFNKYSQFEQTRKDYSLLERGKTASLILNTGTDIFYRELVIKHELNPNTANEFVSMVINELEPMKSNSTFSKVLEILKKIQSNLYN